MKKSAGTLGLLFPNPAMVVGTYDCTGVANVATFAWGGIASSEPACVSIAVRPSRYTNEAIERTGAFTLNLPSVRYAAEVDFFGMVSGRSVRKLETAGLTPVHGEFVDAPYIAEFPFCMECAVVGKIELGSHILYVGEVKDVKIDEELLDDDGTINWEAARILSFDSGTREYRAPGEVVGTAFKIGRKFISR